MKWRPVNEKPETNDDVLLALIIRPETPRREPQREYKGIEIGWFNGEKYEVLEPDVFEYPANYWEGCYEVTHWMPLPQLPQ